MAIRTADIKPRTKIRLKNLMFYYQKPVVQVSTALLLTVITIIFFATFAIRPTLTTIAQLLRKIDDQRDIKEKLDLKIAALASAQSEYILVEPKLHLVDAAIPKSHEFAILMRQTEGAASVLQVPVSGIKLGSDFDLNESSDEVYELKEIPFSVTATAPYPRLGDFLRHITFMQRVTKPELISISQEEKRRDTAIINMSVKLNAYYLPDFEEVEEFEGLNEINN